MPKIFGRDVPPVILGGGVLVLAALVYNMLFPADGAAVRRTTRKPPKKKAAVSDQFRPEDYEAKFASYTTPARSVFAPLVERNAAKTVVNPLTPLKGLSLELTGNEAGWNYTGYAEVDGIRQGLLENTSSGNSVFLRVGQKWRNLTVQSITADALEVSGPEGGNVTIPVYDPSAEQSTTPNVVAANGTPPGTPGAALSGPIGGTAQLPGVAPGNMADMRIQPELGANGMMGQNDGWQGGRRRRRN